MALTTAEKQQRYRERHLGINGGKQRIQFFVSVHAKAQLDRLALHNGYTVTNVIEKLAADAERALLNRLPPQKRTVYLDGCRQRTASHKASSRNKRNTRLSKTARSSPSRLRGKVTV
jgi:hypothetical protein